MYKRELLPGAIGGWVWDDALEVWLYNLLYWKEVIVEMIVEQVAALRRSFYASGFVSKERGRHLNIKRKWMRF